MKKNKGFTLVELVIVLAVSSILLATIGGLSVLTGKLVSSQKNNSVCATEYQSIKNDVEDFISTYCYDYFELNIVGTSLEIENSNSDVVAKLEFKSESKTLSIYGLSDSSLPELTLKSQLDLTKILSISFDYDASSNLVKCSLEFEDYTDSVFLINLGGMEFGSIS